jgi:CDP-6-deoxy-D-xylo-4-hexulose-3-dehydrase
MMRSLRAHGWLRELPQENLVCNKIGNTFEDSFRFALPGYCLRPLEMSGAVGKVQLKKLNTQLVQRTKNAQTFLDLFNNCNYAVVQQETGQSSWFGFSILLRDVLTDKRSEVIDALKNTGIETRPIVAGNFTKNPVCKFINYTTHGSSTNADYIDRSGFFIGNDGRILNENLLLVKHTLDNVYEKYKL